MAGGAVDSAAAEAALNAEQRGIDWPTGQGLVSVTTIIPTGELPMNEKKSIALRSCLVAVLCAPLAAHATIQVPEPGTLSLLGMGLAAIAIVAVRKRRK